MQDARPPQEIVTTKLHVPLILVTRTKDANTFQMTNFAMTMMLLPSTDVLSNTENAYTRKLNVTITTHVLKMFWLTENANTFMLAKMLINVLFLHAMQLKDASTLLKTVTTKTHVPEILATQLPDVSTHQSLAITLMHVTHNTAVL